MGSERGTERGEGQQRERGTKLVCVGRGGKRGRVYRGELLLLCSALALLRSVVVINNKTYCMHTHRGAFPLVDVADRAPVCSCLRLQINK